MSLRAKQVDARRNRILDAAERVFHAQGVAATTLQQIAAAAEVTRGAVYHHFRDKQDFALQVVDAYMVGVHGALDASLADRERPPLDRVRAFFDLVAERRRAPPGTQPPGWPDRPRWRPGTHVQQWCR